jgi:hypothetical protein
MINIGVEVRKRENELPLLKRIDGVPRVLVAIIFLFLESAGPEGLSRAIDGDFP